MNLFGVDLFNSDFKKNSEEKFNSEKEEYKNSINELKIQANTLQECRETLYTRISEAEKILNIWTNTPQTFNKKHESIKLKIKNYKKVLNVTKEENNKIFKTYTNGATGTLIGGSIATLGAPALTTIAMSVGTASTGTAITGLSGAAASNAALAWLGGGSLAAGGAGVAGGESLLSILGPIGWTIGGISLIATGFSLNGKNKKAALKIKKAIVAIEKLIKNTKSEIFDLKNKLQMVNNSNYDLRQRTMNAEDILCTDYSEFTESDKLVAGTLLNNELSAVNILNNEYDKK